MGTFIDDQGNIRIEADLANPNSHNRLVAGSKPAESTFEANSSFSSGRL
jgi:hypothetical protein